MIVTTWSKCSVFTTILRLTPNMLIKIPVYIFAEKQEYSVNIKGYSITLVILKRKLGNSWEPDEICNTCQFCAANVYYCSILHIYALNIQVMYEIL